MFRYYVAVTFLILIGAMGLGRTRPAGTQILFDLAADTLTGKWGGNAHI